MAEFKLGRIKFVWKDNWATGTSYYKDDIVAYGGKTYVCVIGHTADADFYTDLENIPARWNQFSDGQSWKGDWTATTLYKQNDIVKYGGYVYICNNGHTSSSVLETNQSDWDLFAESFDWTGSWDTNTVYKVNDLVKYGGYVYLCNTAHTSASTTTDGLEVDLGKWDVFTKGNDWKGDWSTNEKYKIGDIVKYGGTTYVCNEGHTSAATVSLGLENDQGKWDYFNRGIEYKGDWLSAVRYKVNDVVKSSGGLWICVTDHTSANFVTDNSNWNQFVEGVSFKGEWASTTEYQPGDIVKYGGNTYIVKNSLVASDTPSNDSTNYDLFTTGFTLIGDWDAGTAYRVGQIVRLGGYTYVATADGTNHKPPNGSYWSKLNEGINWSGNWLNGSVYVLGDAVKYGPNSYICVQAHTATTGSDRPDNDITGTYWNLLTAGNEESVLTSIGDLVYYSGAGPTRLPVGDEGQVLTVNSGLPTWKYFGQVKNVFYVAPGGTNSPAPTYGTTLDKPWASVRYALEQVEAGTEYPNAAYLLKMNRTFIQREIAEWVKYQIAHPTGIWVGFTNDNDALCERDMGLIVDAIIYDLTHTGNVKTREATESYFNAAGTALITAIQDEDDQLVAAINYGVTVLQSVLANTAPAANYQTLNGVSSKTKQIIDTSYTAETDAEDVCVSLAAIITDAVTAGTTAGMPLEDLPNYTVNVKTGEYYEVLPMHVPANTAIVGDELRSARISPRGKIIPTNDKAKTIATLTRLQAITDEIITNVSVTPTTGNTETQITTAQLAGSTGSTTAVSSVIANAAEIKDIVANGLGSANAYVYPDPTGYDTGYFNARRLILANKAFLVSEVSAWINAQISGNISPFVGFVYGGTGQTKCERDVGYIVDALVYDLTYGGNLATQIAARSYYSNGVFVETGEKSQALAVQLRIKDISDNIAQGNTAGWTKTTGLTQDVSGTPGSLAAAQFAQARIQEMYDTINTGTEPTTIAPSTAWVATALVTAKTVLDAAKSSIQADAVQYIKREYPTLNFNTTTCSRDVGYMIDALGYDLMFGSNFLSIQNGMAYYRGLESTGIVLTSQKTETLAIIDFISKKASFAAASGAVVQADLLWTDIINYANTGTSPIIIGTNLPNTDVNVINGGKILELNKEFMVAEATAYIANTFKATVTASTGGTDTFTCSSQTWMVAGDAVVFTGTTFGGVTTSTTYYVLASGLTATTFKVSTSLDSTTPVDLSTATGTMTVKYSYNQASCENDVRNYITAISQDLMYTGNYNSTRAARYYRSALTGSRLEWMFYVRNGCGIRNQTLFGLDGSSDGNISGAGSYPDGLYEANEFGTRRPVAGAYVSLDPGWGPNDDRVWVTTRSTYVQNVTTFGTGATGQKIDGSLHAGGVDSIVSNDFTQVISGGIGAWVTNLGRAELVSVFTYYSHVGYLAENGGKIRATNGNNSYGDFGSVAEGVDVTEVPVLGQINNRASEANVRSVLTDGQQILAYEFGNAGTDYTEATFTTSGAGYGVTTVANEFRDGAVFNVRLTDPGDSSGIGGVGYVTAANLAQDGNTTQITLAAADTSSSAAYVGMRIDIIAGTGAGQYGYINTYSAGSKIATIYKPSTGTAGWEHIVAGTPIEAALDVTSSYVITPRLTFTAPPFTKTVADITTSAAWADVVYGDGYGAYTGLSATGGTGSLATFDVSRRRGVYTVELVVPGALYTAGDTLTISGALLGGTSPANDVTITVETVNSPSGSISYITSSGTAISDKYVAVGTGVAAYSLDGVTWTSVTMPTAASGGGGEPNNQWSSIAYGAINGVSFYVAVAKASATGAYSRDGINWTASSLSEVADWCDVAYGNGSFVAIAASDSSSAFRALSTNATSWSINTIANGAVAIAYGGSRFVEIEGNFSNSVAYSASGAAWTVTTLPSNDDSTESNWVDIAYGNGRFVAISDSSAMAAYSFNGATWYKSNLPGLYEWSSINYGQGVFYVTSKGEYSATSPDGVTWTLRDGSTASLNATSTAKNKISTAFTESTALTSGTWTDVIYTGSSFYAVGYSGSAGLYAYSTNGTSWTNSTLPTVNSTYEYTSIAYNGTNQYVAIIGGNGGTRNIAYSSNGTSWTGQLNALSGNAYWKQVIWAGDRYIALRGDGAAVNYSTDGTTWTNSAVTSGSSEMSSVAYGNIGGTNYIVTVSGYSTGSQTSSYSTNGGVSWTSGNTLPSSSYWSSVTFGNGKFVAVAGSSGTPTTKAAYSTNGTTWTAATMPGAAANWNKVVYASTGYVAFAYGSSRTAYSEDGITWVEGPAQATSRNWGPAAYGGTTLVSAATGTTYASKATFVLNTNYVTTSSTTNLRAGDKVKFTGTTLGGLISGSYYYITSVPSSTEFTVSTTQGGSNVVLTTGSGTSAFLASRDFVASALGNYNADPRWVVLATGTAGVQNIRQGATTRARAYVSPDNQITEIWITEPGSGYVTPPTMTITDPNNTGSDATSTVRVGNGAIAQPMFTNRGTGYTAASADISGNGYADNYQVSTYVSFKNLDGVPKAGANVQIAGIDDVWYRLVNVTGLIPNGDGTYNATLQLSPALGAAEAPEHEAAVTIRRRYSQVRLTGHDLLDIGTGNIISSNYPGLPLVDPVPAQEYRLSEGGRVFYTSTDQDGNFRVGGLFNVEQATGIATLNADAFNIAGLNELSLGSVALGGSGATITEFSTDPFFTADSDSVVPTQRAIKAYITSQIGGGGSSLNVNTLTAGVIYIAGQTIATTTNVAININTKVNFKGGIVGDALVLNYFLLNN